MIDYKQLPIDVTCFDETIDFLLVLANYEDFLRPESEVYDWAPDGCFDAYFWVLVLEEKVMF